MDGDAEDDGHRPRVDWLTVGGPARAWTDLGLTMADGHIPLAGTGLQVTGEGLPGMRGWVVSGAGTGDGEIDGVPTTRQPATSAGPEVSRHPLGVRSLDHVVVTTDNLSRTCDAIAAALAAPLKRVRELGHIRQGFHRVGHRRDDGLIVEVVERPDAPSGGASLWGLVLIVDDLDTACHRLGPDRVGAPKDAVQPGRRIATLRSAAGLGVPVALMSPEG